MRTLFAQPWPLRGLPFVRRWPVLALACIGALSVGGSGRALADDDVEEAWEDYQEKLAEYHQGDEDWDDVQEAYEEYLEEAAKHGRGVVFDNDDYPRRGVHVRVWPFAEVHVERSRPDVIVGPPVEGVVERQPPIVGGVINPPPAPEAEYAMVAEIPGIQIETRGPVHEAYAEPIVYDPEAGITVTRRPPELIDEVPPNQKPEGDNVVWIPGYWAWDEDRNDFIWVSGIWRNLPPGRQWIPGYWTQVSGGWQWVAGYWLGAQISQVEYLPQPPESLENGPVGDAPGPDHVWVPGTWLYREARYVWRPGYWLAPQMNWVWVPAHYSYTPVGYVYVSGYWDYTLTDRGLLFAPAYIQPAVYSRPSFVYTPSVVVNTTVFVTNLFARPRYYHYYFGDYYSREYVQTGIYPAFAFHSSRYGYDPIFATYISRHGDRRAYIERLRRDFHYRRDHVDARPPRTWTAMQTLLRNPERVRSTNVNINQLAFARPLSQVSQFRDYNVRLQRVQPDRLDQYRQTIRQARDYQAQRMRMERQLRGQAVAPPAEGNRPNEADRQALDQQRQRAAENLRRQSTTQDPLPAPRDLSERGTTTPPAPQPPQTGRLEDAQRLNEIQRQGQTEAQRQSAEVRRQTEAQIEAQRRSQELSEAQRRAQLEAQRQAQTEAQRKADDDVQSRSRAQIEAQRETEAQRSLDAQRRLADLQRQRKLREADRLNAQRNAQQQLDAQRRATSPQQREAQQRLTESQRRTQEQLETQRRIDAQRQGRLSGRPVGPDQPLRLNLPRSPYAGQSQGDRRFTPPARPKAPAVESTAPNRMNRTLRTPQDEIDSGSRENRGSDNRGSNNRKR